MGATRDMWISKVELVCEDFARDRLTFEEAQAQLVRLGLDQHEAADMLQNEAA